jgi:hypothetical protein
MKTTEELYARALEGIGRFWKWAENEGIPKELAYDLISEGDDPEPPFHKVLAWFDLLTPQGVKVHGTARGNVTPNELENVLRVTENVTGKLIEDGWKSVDWSPRAEATEMAMESSEEGFRTIAVDSIRKGFTDSGKLYYNVKGFPWKDWGVKAWPDSSNIAKTGLDLDNWDVEKNAEITFNTGELYAVVALKPDGKPLKVADWSGPNVRLDDVEEIPF